MKLFDVLSINKRLFINTLISLGFLIAMAVVGWWSFQEVKVQANHMQDIQEHQTANIALFQQSLVTTTQKSSEYILSPSNVSNQAFNQAIDALKEQTKVLASVVSFGAESTIIDDLSVILTKYKKSTNANVFLQKEIGNTLNYGIDPAVANLQESIATLKASSEVQDQPNVHAALNDLNERLRKSQSVLSRLISTKKVDVIQQFDQSGLGDGAQASIALIEDSLGSNFELRDAVGQLVDGRDVFQESIKDIKDYLVTTQENNQSLIHLVNDANRILQVMSTNSNTNTLNQIQALTLMSSNQTKWLMVISGFAVLLMLAFNGMLLASITTPLRKVKQQIAHIVETGELSHWQPLKGSNELVDMSEGIHQLLQAFQKITGELQTVGEGLSKGNFEQSITQDYRGDFLTLKQNFNQSIEQVQHTMSTIQAMSQALQEGRLDFSQHVSAFNGDYQRVVMSLNAAFEVQKLAIAAVKDVMQSMNEGDFSKRITVDMPGDLTQLRAYLNAALQKLDNAISDKSTTLMHFKEGNFSYQTDENFEGKLNELKQNLDTMATHISHMLSEVQMASTHAVQGVKEISMGNQDLSQRVSQQAISIQSTMDHMREMIHQVNQSHQSAISVNQKSQEAKQNTINGADIVNRMFESIQDIQRTSLEISNFTQVIDDIAFQTNLLALNAAVEAARAGEQGRGFAVVAGEVRVLAGKSAEASQNIQRLTKSSLASVQQGISLGRLTKQAFEENAESIDDISQMMADMQQLLNQQAAGIQEVSQSLQDINDVTQQNAALVEEVAQTSESIIGSVQGVETRLQSFKLRHATVRPANDDTKRLGLIA